MSQTEHSTETSRSKTSNPHGARLGDTVRFEEEQSDGSWIKRTVKLADKCDSKASPPEIGPDTPLYKALFNKSTGKVVKSTRRVKLLLITSGSA